MRLKKMERSYAVEAVIKDVIPRLEHGNDGLIYTCAESGYVAGTDPRMSVFRLAITAAYLPFFFDFRHQTKVEATFRK